MKKKTARKLELSRETVRHLDAAQMKDVEGGCWTYDCRGTQPCCVETYHECGVFCTEL